MCYWTALPPTQERGDSMLNEIEEFEAYITFPEYAVKNKYDGAYLGRFNFDMLIRWYGMEHVLTIIARKYMWETDVPDYERAYRALCAWCSLPETKKTRPEKDGQSETCYANLHGEFPELVDETGAGWFYRHVQNILRFAKETPEALSKASAENCETLKNDFEKAWRDKLMQYQVPVFAPSSQGSWLTSFDDVVADAKQRGPLRNNDITLPGDMEEKLIALTPKSVPVEILPILVKYYKAHKTAENDWVVLPEINFNAYFGTTSFSKKWLPALPESIIERQEKYGVCRYRVRTEALQ